VSRQRATSLVFGATMALAGFLLFQVQPLLGKYLLPWFGGSAATWLVCLMFFQLALLAGYMHAYAVTLPLAVPRQVWAQLAVLAAGLLLLPITPAETWKPVDASDPTWRIVALLALSVGLPYMVLATTTPLLSRWLAHLEPSLDPARFYAASNLGSFAGLLSYPFLFERLLASQEQTLWWSWAYGLYALLFAACGVVTLLRAGSTDTAGAAQPMRGRGGRPVLAWIGLAALGSGLLLATTNAVGQWSAVVPFLWVVPLAVYLLSFVIAFGAPQLHRPTMFSAAFLLLAGAVFLPGAPESTPSFLTQLALNAATLFAGLMLCHGELARRTPEAAELPHFYLAIAAGGALGGALVTVAAPLAFTDYFEHPLLLAAVAALAVALMLRTPNGDAARRLAAATAGVALLCFVAGFAVGLWRELAPERALIERVRNFYGVVKVVREDGEGGPPSLVMERMEPSCAFGRASALALALTYTAKRRADTASPLRIGVVGLGAGMVAAHGRPGDRLRYYELNPAVLTLVERHFTYVKDGKADTDVLLGDGRLLLERQLAAGEPQGFDVLVLNAFRGAAPPMHLMTKEAFDIYLAHLTEGGILAVNFEVQLFEMAPLHRGLARRLGLEVAWFDPKGGEDCEAAISWALYSKDKAFFATPRVRSAIAPWRDSGRRPDIVWTDADSNLVSIINWRGD
jgi:hypothetical protein